MDFKQLQSFVSVVRYQSFTKAAEHLFLSQPTISNHICQLEEELSKRLILRTTKSIELTPVGQEMYEYASKILELKDRMIDSCTSNQQKMLHIGASTIPSAYILPELLSEFGRRSPDTYFTIHQSDSEGIIKGLLEGLFDIGMIGMKSENDKIECEPFCQDHMILITPVNEHFLRIKQQEEVSVLDFLNEPIITRESGSGSQKTADRFLEKVGITEKDLNIIARINDQEAIKNMVAQGLGISIISEMAAKNFLSEKRILGFSLSEYNAGRELYLIYRKNYILPPYLRSFLNFIKEQYR